jgi:tetratricopeptide (TPR) repeat protein
MPKVIKKRVAKKKPVQENEVKSAALQALYKIKERQKHLIIAVSIVAAVVILYVLFALYSSSLNKKAYSIEKEAYNIYYGAKSAEPMPDEEKWKKALELYEKSVDVKVTPTALFYLGNCYFNLGDYDNAIKEYNKFIDKFSSETGILPLVYQKLAPAYFRNNKNDKALETLDKLANVENGIFRDTALILQAGYYENAGEKEKALEKYREIITDFPDSPWSAEANKKVSAKEAKKSEATPEEPAPEIKKEETEEKQSEKPEVKERSEESEAK